MVYDDDITGSRGPTIPAETEKMFDGIAARSTSPEVIEWFRH